MTQVLLIDDHPIVRQGCRQLLADDGVDKVVEAQTLAQGFRLYRTERPDVIIVDLTLGNSTLGGLSFVRRIRVHDPCTGMLVFTMHNDPVIVSRALELGATGYVLKDASAEEVLRAFRKVREGQRYISHGLASEVAFSRLRGRQTPFNA